MKLSRSMLVLGLAAAVVAACIIAERGAESAAHALCQQFPVGSDFHEALRIAAIQDARRLVTADSVTVIFVGVPPFSRHSCQIVGANDKVAATRYFRDD